MKKVLIIFILISVFCLLSAPFVFAQGFKFEVPLPALPGAPAGPGSTIASYINYIFVFAILLAGFLALGMMTLGGVQYVLAAGNASKVESAKEKIQGALIGLGVILVSFLLLRTINPDLVSLSNPSFTPLLIKSAQFNVTIPGIGPANIPTINTGESCKIGETKPGGYFCLDDGTGNGKWNLVISGT